MSGDIVLRARGVAKTYQEGDLRTEVLRDVSFSIPRGQTVADRRRTAVDRRNADVCMEVDGAEFARRFVEALTARGE